MSCHFKGQDGFAHKLASGNEAALLVQEASASEPGGHNFLNSIVTPPALFFMLRPFGLALRGATPP